MKCIKFRGKRIDNGEWITGSLINNAFYKKGVPCTYIFDNSIYPSYDSFDYIAEILDEMEVDPKTVGQFINKLDMNKKEIFEGDEVRILYTDWPSQSDYSISLEKYKKSISQTGKIVFHNCSFEIEFTFGDQSNYGYIDPGTHGEIEVITDPLN